MQYLAHHGIDGQKWGKRNGPPYPLDSSAKTQAEKKANYSSSHRIAEAGGTKGLTDQELKDVANRIKTEQEIKKLTSKDVNAGLNFIKNVAGTISSINAAGQSIIKLMNAINDPKQSNIDDEIEKAVNKHFKTLDGN